MGPGPAVVAFDTVIYTTRILNPMREALGTSLAVIAANCVPAPRRPQHALRRGFSVFLVVVAALILYQNLGTVLAAWSRNR
jgi:hypothetical protein